MNSEAHSFEANGILTVSGYASALAALAIYPHQRFVGRCLHEHAQLGTDSDNAQRLSNRIVGFKLMVGENRGAEAKTGPGEATLDRMDESFCF